MTGDLEAFGGQNSSYLLFKASADFPFQVFVKQRTFITFNYCKFILYIGLFCVVESV